MRCTFVAIPYSLGLSHDIPLHYSTTLCTDIVKNVASQYIHNGSAVLKCFLDASKAFDMVDHGVVFSYVP